MPSSAIAYLDNAFVARLVLFAAKKGENKSVVGLVRHWTTAGIASRQTQPAHSGVVLSPPQPLGYTIPATIQAAWF